MDYARKRNEAFSMLTKELFRGGYYFGGETLAKIKEFLIWNKKYAVSTVDELPPDTDLLKWRDDVMETMREAL